MPLVTIQYNSICNSWFYLSHRYSHACFGCHKDSLGRLSTLRFSSFLKLCHLLSKFQSFLALRILVHLSHLFEYCLYLCGIKLCWLLECCFCPILLGKFCLKHFDLREQFISLLLAQIFIFKLILIVYDSHVLKSSLHIVFSWIKACVLRINCGPLSGCQESLGGEKFGQTFL